MNKTTAVVTDATGCFPSLRDFLLPLLEVETLGGSWRGRLPKTEYF